MKLSTTIHQQANILQVTQALTSLNHNEARSNWIEALSELARQHPSSSHPLFACLESSNPTKGQVAHLLKNYDAHASVLRRLLLRAASIMPEDAVGFILENVRNEYGNGINSHRHQLQLLDLVNSSGITASEFKATPVCPKVKIYIQRITQLYYPLKSCFPRSYFRPAIAAGAITATELMAVYEFKAMQQAFAKLGLEHHIWFDHVKTEIDHADESLELALCFIENYRCQKEIILGLTEVLDANYSLYDGLLGAFQGSSSQDTTQ